MKVSAHAVEVFEVRDASTSPAYVDIEIARSKMIRIANE
jgi:hypothetical protein